MADLGRDVPERRSDVLDAALRTFTRFGYRKTSMDDIAGEARISRPGLYFLFASKSGLFREAADRGIELDLAAAERALETTSRAAEPTEPPLAERLVDAFDCWAGRYVGPLHDTAALIADNPDLLGPVALAGPRRFESLVTTALRAAGLSDQAATLARTLVSLSIGVKQQATERAEYRRRMAEGVALLVRSGPAGL